MKKVRTIQVGASIFEENDSVARANMQVLKERGIFCVNVMGSPGSGKTALLERSVKALMDKGIRTAVIEGDINGSLDGERLAVLGIPVVQVNTGGACHMDANMVRKGMEMLGPDKMDILFIENVGNLVCPAEFRLGEDVSVIVSSVPEGEEKPLKYPLMFRISSLCILNKSDLLEFTGFKIERFREYLFESASGIDLILLSARTGEGMNGWMDFLARGMDKKKSPRIVVAGMGDRMKGDDGAGCEVVEMLKKERLDGNVSVIDAGNAIENYLGVISKMKPGRVIIIDAVDFGGRPGDAMFLDAASLVENTSSTHTFSLPLIIEHIRRETGAECLILGIQPERISFSHEISLPARQGVSKAVGMIREIISKP